jgi:hypothetical protein
MEKTNVGGVMGFTRRKIVLIHHMPQLLTLIQAIHVPIAMYMGMMPIIASHFTQSYNKANHKTPMLIRVKVLARAKRGKVLPTNGQPLSQRKASPTPWRLGLHG